MIIIKVEHYFIYNDKTFLNNTYFDVQGISFLQVTTRKDKNFGWGQSSGEYIEQHEGMGFRNKEEILW